MRNFFFLAIVLLLTACQAVADDYRVKYVQDGDSLVICCDKGKAFTVRLKDIDAPEKNQPFAKASKEYLQSLVQNKPLTLIGSKKDRYGRLLADIIVDKKSVNNQMLATGHAWLWRYTKSKKLKALQEQAQEKKLGLWALPESQRIEPLEWRKRHSRKK